MSSGKPFDMETRLRMWWACATTPKTQQVWRKRPPPFIDSIKCWDRPTGLGIRAWCMEPGAWYEVAVFRQCFPNNDESSVRPGPVQAILILWYTLHGHDKPMIHTAWPSKTYDTYCMVIPNLWYTLHRPSQTYDTHRTATPTLWYSLHGHPKPMIHTAYIGHPKPMIHTA